MGKIGHVPTDLQDGIRDALGRKTMVAYATVVNLEIKPDKYDSRVLALTDYRLFILTPKPPMKVEVNLHFLDINLLESKSPKKMVVGTESRRLVMTSTAQENEAEEYDLAASHILVSLAKVFPTVPTERLISKVEFSPSTRLQDSYKMVADIGQKDQGPCGNFSAMYRCMCDYHNLEFQEDVAWDVDTIYLSQDSKEMNLNDFDHLDGRHLQPIISALEHNTWFTRLNTSNVKLTPEAVNEILKIMKTNVTVEELVLSNIGVRSEFSHRLCMALIANTGSPLTVLDLSGNLIEDKGLNHLCGPITKLSRGLVELNLSRTGITARGANRLAEALLSNKNIPMNLRCLDLSENSFRGEEVSVLFSFLAQPNALTDLRLGSTECALENLFAALQRGCVQSLAHLDVSSNLFSSRKPGKDISVPPSWKQFFASAISLKSVNFSSNRLPSEALRCVLEGVGSNPLLTDFELNLSSNGFGLPGNQGGQVLEACLSSVKNIGHLDISDNGFDVALASILGKLSQNKSLRKLSIGRNLTNIKPKNVPQVIEAIIQLIHQEFSPIQCLNVDNLRLKMETVLLINALGTNNTLVQIDLSGNHMGDTGARMLSKALMINKKLSTIYWDHNATSPNGFQDVAAALEKNFTVHKMPTPVNDAAQALRVNQEKTEQALQKIESILQRNHSPRKLPTDQAYRLQQGFMVGTLQQVMDRHLVRLQDLIDKLESIQLNYQLNDFPVDVQLEVTKAQTLLKEAERARTFLLQLHKVVQEAESDARLQMQLNALAGNLHDVAAKQLKTNLSAMVECAENQFPMTLKNGKLQASVLALSTARSQLSAEFIQNLVTGHLAADVMNKTSELNLMVASHISDHILDEVIVALEDTAKSLGSVVNGVRSHLLISGKMKDDDKESREHRDNIKRKKSSSVAPDEEQDVASEMPSLSEKHKSQLTRRLRPQSAIDASDVKKALELCRTKADLVTTYELDAGHERSLSEERRLEVDEGRNGSPVPTPLPRKRRGQSDLKSQTVTTSGTPGKSELGRGSARDASLSLTAGVSSRMDPSSLNPSQAVTAKPQRKSDLSELNAKEAAKRTSDAVDAKEVPQASTTDVPQKVMSRMPGDVSGQTNTGKIEEKSRKSLPNEASLAPPLDDKLSDLTLTEGKVASANKEKDVTLDSENGKPSGAAKPDLPHLNFFPSEDTSTPKLSHLGKDRPKRQKTKAMTQPMTLDPIIDEDDVGRGVSAFFEAKPLPKAERKENGEVPALDEAEELAKSDMSNKKEKVKTSALSPKMEVKGIASGIKNFFKKKSPDGDAPAPAVKSASESSSTVESNQSPQKGDEQPSEPGDDAKNSEEISKHEAEEAPESRPKQPAGIAKIGLPGMTGVGNFPELRAKKAVVKPGVGEVGKPPAGEATKDMQNADRKSSQSKETAELLSVTEDGVSSRLSGSIKGRPPPPLAPKPNKRTSVIGVIPPTTAAAPTPKPEAEELQTQEPEQKTEPPQLIDPAAPERKKRMSVREKAAHIDKNSNLKSAETAATGRKSATLSADSSPRSSAETVAHRPSSDYSVTSSASSSSSSAVLDVESEPPPPVPLAPPPSADDEDEDESGLQSDAKRLSNVDVIRI